MTGGYAEMVRDMSDFNSHAHVERDVCFVALLVACLVISTHTLTWSVTPQSVAEGDYHGISTHTLTWSVTA